MSTSNPNGWVHLTRDPNSYWRQLFVKGTEFLARDLYAQYVDPDQPMTPEQIAENYGVPVEAVREAIAYCESDPPEIRQDLADQEAWFAGRRWQDGRLVSRESD
jgi:hypothetical protein